MSGVATATNKAVEIVKGTNASIADTRKNSFPGMRPLQKYAVDSRAAAETTRYNLSDAAMLKDNHVDAAAVLQTLLQNSKQSSAI